LRKQAFQPDSRNPWLWWIPVDINPALAPDLTADIRTHSGEGLPSAPLVVWAAPPDTAEFHYPECWEKDGSYVPIGPAAENAVDLFRKTIALITMMKPTWWFIENPKSLLRTMPLIADFNRGYPTRTRRTIKHWEYSSPSGRESDVWTNAYWWMPRPEPDDNGPPETKGPRRVPPYVYAEMLEQLDAQRTKCR
jgi:hypothetical protein